MAEPSLRERALRLLARREHSRAELARKLAPHAAGPEEIGPLLDALQAAGWLSDRRVVEQLVDARRRRWGPARIVHALREKGVAAEAIDAAMEEVRAGEFEAAREVWRKKFGEPPADARERARQARFLAARGFSADVIRRVMGGDEPD